MSDVAVTEQVLVESSFKVAPDVEYSDVLPGKWNIHRAKNATVYLHETVGMEAAMKLFVWEDGRSTKKAQVKHTKNVDGRVVGIVTRSF